MNNLNQYIQEKLKINKDIKVAEYTCQPKDRDELREILKERLEKDKNADLNDIDVSKIIDMSYLFENLDPHNIDISKWDVSNVKDMEKIFYNCRNFNCDLSEWDIKKVKTLYKAFYKCESFTCNLENWNTKRKNKNSMFWGCTSLKNRPSWYKE